MGQYGRIGKRRSGSATWQWMLLGFFPGILCGGVLIFAMFASGALNSLTSASLPTGTAVIIREVQVVTATSGPATEVVATSVPASETPSAPVGTAADFVMPSPTTFSLVPEGTAVSVGPTATPALSGSQSIELTTIGGANPQPTVAGAVAAAPTSGVPAALQTGLTAMSNISGGTFTMGTTPDEVIAAVAECVNRDEGNCLEAYGVDSSPQFQVQVNAFQMDRTEVTFGQYTVFLTYLLSQGKNHRDACPSPNGASNLCIQTVNEKDDAVITFDGNNYNVPPGSLTYPVYGVTWAGAQAYCQAIGRRLPTEAEWEFAAKGMDPGRLYPWGNLWNPANAKTRIPKDIPPGTVAVGSYPGAGTPNGLLDMAGNVEEWVNDWYGATYYSELDNQAQPVLNPTGPGQGTEKVLRGGSWDALPFFARTVHRRSYQPAPDGNEAPFPRSIGFRCAADASAGAPGATSIPVLNGTPDPANLGATIPTAVTPTVAGAEGAPITNNQQG